MSAPVLSPRMQQVLLEIMRELGRPVTTEELARLLQERLRQTPQAQ